MQLTIEGQYNANHSEYKINKSQEIGNEVFYCFKHLYIFKQMYFYFIQYIPIISISFYLLSWKLYNFLITVELSAAIALF